MSAQTKSYLERVTEVLEHIQGKIKNDNATKANLKRALSGDSRHLRAIYPVILPLLSEQEIQYQLDQWLLITSLFAFYPQELNLETSLNFGVSARRLMGDGSSKGPERRFRALLDTSIEDIQSPLTAMVRLMKAKGIPINYPQLLVDLGQWNHSDQYIQDKWAQAFWNARRSDNDKTAEEDVMT